MRTLIFGCVYIDGRNHWGQDNLRLFNVWRKLARTLNPGCDLLVVNSGSPIEPPAYGSDINLRFPDRLGHFFHDRFSDTPPSGWPRPRDHVGALTGHESGL